MGDVFFSVCETIRFLQRDPSGASNQHIARELIFGSQFSGPAVEILDCLVERKTRRCWLIVSDPAKAVALKDSSPAASPITPIITLRIRNTRTRPQHSLNHDSCHGSAAIVNGRLS